VQLGLTHQRGANGGGLLFGLPKFGISACFH
jgi:hypothetical protein